MRFSLIVATFGRNVEVATLLDSFAAQQYRDFEVIVVDQNAPGFLSDIRARHAGSFKRLVWSHVDFRAANMARNHGLDKASGDVVTFADDDCEYHPDTLSTVARLFREHPHCSVLTGKAVDRATGVDSMSIWPAQPQVLGLRNILNLSLEFTTFYRRTALANERLDPRFGPGTRFGSREGPDLMLRLFYRELRMRYEPSISIFHPEKFTSIADPVFLRRTQSYEIGFGALLAKHLALRRSVGVIAMLAWRALVEGILGWLKNIVLLRFAKARFWRLLLTSRIRGFQDYRAGR
ncbi:MAG TPA: glycosyltransferase family 2 protein [Ideonella sp.]|uniref:glycosyltransferase family A protein n=1 Tax=Ideonella sp. TaxID=1929293 RepID=UPI002C77FC07|nr:glycosyltransferase family 2 protein [Ideonella sp.]HSI48430.1 glycosyltransferase family 2 protein [Ideonella sp.]